NDQLIDVYDKIRGDTSIGTYPDSDIKNVTLILNSLLSGTQFSQEDIDEQSSNYTDIIIDKLNDDQIEKGENTIDVNGDDTDVNKVTLKINRSETKSILKSVLEKAKKDKDIKKIAEDQFKVEDYEDSVDDALQEVKDTDKDDFPSIKSVIWE